jgi:hypothetical protein
MVDELGFPPSRPVRRGGKTVPMHRAWRARCAEADLLRRAAARLRDEPETARQVGLAGPDDAFAWPHCST